VTDDGGSVGDVAPGRPRQRNEALGCVEGWPQRVSPLAARLEPIDASRCLLEAGGLTAASLGLYVAMLDCEFEVLDPPELKDALRRLSRRMARAARG
jgi:hypothetical protein